MRNFHNIIKTKLINDTSQKILHDIHLLDIGVGRGGDIIKWSNAKIKNVIGIDISKSYILEAVKRFRNLKLSYTNNFKFYYCLSSIKLMLI